MLPMKKYFILSLLLLLSSCFSNKVETEGTQSIKEDKVMHTAPSKILDEADYILTNSDL